MVWVWSIVLSSTRRLLLSLISSTLTTAWLHKARQFGEEVDRHEPPPTRFDTVCRTLNPPLFSILLPSNSPLSSPLFVAILFSSQPPAPRLNSLYLNLPHLSSPPLHPHFPLPSFFHPALTTTPPLPHPTPLHPTRWAFSAPVTGAWAKTKTKTKTKTKLTSCACVPCRRGGMD